MNARERYDAMLRDEIAPLLRERGFRKRRNRFRRVVDGSWQVIDFQASQFGSRNDVQFTINLWVGVPDLGGDDADDQQIGERIGPVMLIEDHWWSLEGDTDVESLAEELRAVVTEHALPWLEARGSLDQLVALARAHPKDFPRHLLGRFAMLLEQSGFADLAAEFRGA
jgi:hypothetical protein